MIDAARLDEIERKTHNRPEWVHCVEHSHKDLKNTSWCGRRRAFGWHFAGADHAAENGRQRGRLVVCRECAAAISDALRNGHDDPEYTAQTKGPT